MDIKTEPKMKMSRMKRYYNNNKEQVKQRNNEYYHKNKETIRQKLRDKVECTICKAVVSKGNILRHQKNPKCQATKEAREAIHKQKASV
jgi:ribosomal protein L15